MMTGIIGKDLSHCARRLRVILCAFVLLYSCVDFVAFATMKVYYPMSGGCSALFGAYSVDQDLGRDGVLDRSATDYSAEVKDAETFVHEFYRDLVKSGKYELFSEQALDEFIREDASLPQDRIIYVVSRNDITSEIEGVLRVFVGFSEQENWRLYGVGNPGWGRNMQPNTDPRLPMEYHQITAPNGFFRPMKMELGRLVTVKGGDRLRIVSDMIYGLFETVFLPMTGSNGVAPSERFIDPARDYVGPQIYVHTDPIRSRLYQRIGFGDVTAQLRQGGRVRDGEVVLSLSLDQLYINFKAGLDRSKNLFDTHSETGNLDQALQVLTATVDKFPSGNSFVEGQLHLARLLIAKGDGEAAARHASAAWKAKPHSAAAIATMMQASLRSFLDRSNGLTQNSAEYNSALREFEKVAGELEGALGGIQIGRRETGIRAAYADMRSVFYYQKMLFAIYTGRSKEAREYREKFMASTGDAEEVLGWSASSVIPRKATINREGIRGHRYAFRSSPYYVDVTENDRLETVSFKVVSQDPLSDYADMQRRAGFESGMAATWEFHEVSHRLAQAAGLTKQAKIHAEMSQLFNKPPG